MSTQADVWIYDIETWDNFFLIGVMQPDQEEVQLFEVSEEIDNRAEIFNFFNVPTRHFVGYNNHYFDNVVMNYFLSSWDRLKPGSCEIRPFTSLIHHMGQKVIENTNPKNLKYLKFFQSFDLMRVGNIQKSLKMVAVNLRWKLIKDLPYTPFEDLPRNAFEEARRYNINDVLVTRELFLEMRDDINLRGQISYAYKVNVMNEADSGMANRLLEKMYSEATGMPVKMFIYRRTHRDEISISDVVLPQIKFQTKKMQRWLDDLKSGVIPTSGQKISYRIRIGNSVYDIGAGGLHSNNPSELFESTEEEHLIDADVESYYPTIMIQYSLKPAHLDDSFLELLNQLTKRRLKAKREGDKIAAAALKIVVNSIFGKTGFEYHWLYDTLCMYRVTLNGQLFLLMLVEALEKEGIPVFYANTDGITAKVRPDQRPVYDAICRYWEEYTGFNLEFEKFELAVIRDVNNFLVVKKSGEKMKGALDIYRWQDLRKGFDKPIISMAIRAFFVNGVLPEEFITNHEDVLDFCMAQKADSSFEIVYDVVSENKINRIEMQKANRYYVSTQGGALLKKSKTKEISLVAGETVCILNDLENDKQLPIKYAWYIRQTNKIIQLFQTKQADLFE